MSQLAPSRIAARLAGVQPRHERHLLALIEVARAIGTIVDRSMLMRTIVRYVTRVFDADRSSLYLHDAHAARLRTEVAEGLENPTVILTIPDDRGVCGHVFQTRKPVRVADTLSDPRFARDIADETGYYPRSMLGVPVMRNTGECVGVLQVMDRRADYFEKNDIALLEAIAVQVAVSLENARLHQAQVRQFNGFVRAFSAALDARDHLTARHSINVANYAMGIALEMKVPDDEVECLRIAGLLHDIGKIGVPETVLTKPGKLTEEEFAWIRRHPEIGHRILKDIPQLHDILPGVLYHHERFDGRGYPEGIAGDDIPLVARVISLADAFDAMSSTRTYRPTLSRPDVLKEIVDCAGTQFDPELAPIFVRLDFSEFDRMFAEHSVRERKGQDKDQAA